MANITLPCGCTLFCEKTDDKITSIDLDLEIEEINLNCDKTWDLIRDQDAFHRYIEKEVNTFIKGSS